VSIPSIIYVLPPLLLLLSLLLFFTVLLTALLLRGFFLVSFSLLAGICSSSLDPARRVFFVDMFEDVPQLFPFPSPVSCHRLFLGN